MSIACVKRVWWNIKMKSVCIERVLGLVERGY